MRQPLLFQTLAAGLLVGTSWLAAAPPAQSQSQMKAVAEIQGGPNAVIFYERQVLVPQRQQDALMVWDQKQLNHLTQLSQCQPSALLPMRNRTFLVSCTQAPRLLVLNPMGQVTETWPRPREEAGLVKGTQNLNLSAEIDLTGITAMVQDSRGGTYIAVAGTVQPDSNAARRGRIYYLSASRTSLTPVAALLDYPAGLALSADDKFLYVSEGLSRQVQRFEVSQTQLLNPQVILKVPEIHTALPSSLEDPRPGALALNSRGHLYIALQGEGRILVTSLEGRKLATLQIPMPFVTGFSFGRSDRTLYITGTPARDPAAAGYLYEMQL